MQDIVELAWLKASAGNGVGVVGEIAEGTAVALGAGVSGVVGFVAVVVVARVVHISESGSVCLVSWGTQEAACSLAESDAAMVEL